MAAGPDARASQHDVRRLAPTDAVAQFSFLVHRTLERRAAEHDISIVQARLLGILRDRTPTINELAKLLGLDKSSVSGLADRAERRGLVERVPSIADRRSVVVRLTDDGRSLVAGVGGLFEEDIFAMLGCLTAVERETLAGLLGRVLVTYATERGVDLFATLPGA